MVDYVKKVVSGPIEITFPKLKMDEIMRFTEVMVEKIGDPASVSPMHAIVENIEAATLELEFLHIVGALMVSLRLNLIHHLVQSKKREPTRDEVFARILGTYLAVDRMVSFEISYPPPAT